MESQFGVFNFEIYTRVIGLLNFDAKDVLQSFLEVSYSFSYKILSRAYIEEKTVRFHLEELRSAVKGFIRLFVGIRPGGLHAQEDRHSYYCYYYLLYFLIIFINLCDTTESNTPVEWDSCLDCESLIPRLFCFHIDYE